MVDPRAGYLPLNGKAAIERAALDLLEQALEVGPDARRPWLDAQGADARSLSRARELLDSLEREDRRIATGAARGDAELLQPPERIGAYRIVELLGQGGMGAVFRGVRAAGDFEHEVAIKLIRPAALTDAMIERFERERQILARLTHPHIARLLDGGTTDEGGPFIIMEYVAGNPITEWADARGLSLDGRLRLFLDLCGAVGHAHQNLVIHRDITPANVLVTAAGEAKLIDFGIARPQQEATPRGNDKLASLSLTPGFAAPERFSGAHATTLTDIYSLGKLLEALVEGGKGDPDLAAIIAKAAADAPQDRYASASALAKDVERFRGHFPVEARTGARGYALRKFLGRRKLAVTAAALILLLLAGGLFATSIGFRQARLAKSEAEARLADTRSIANAMMFEVFDSVSERTGNSRARLLIARTAQRYLTEIAEDPNATVEMRLAAGRGFHRLATATGALDVSNSGDFLQGIALLRRAVEMLEDLMQEAPSDEARLALANVYTSLARDKGLTFIDVPTSLPDLERAAALLREIEEQTPEVIAARGRTQRYLGDVLACCFNRAAEGQIAIEEGLELIERADASVRNVPAVRRVYNDLTNLRGGFRRFIDNDEAGSIATFNRALSAQRALTDETRAAADYRLLATITINLGRALLRGGRPADADQVLSIVHRETQQLYAGDPSDNDLQRRLSYVLIIRARAAADVRDRARAERYLRDGLRLARAAEQPVAGLNGSRLIYAHHLQEASDAQWALGNRDAACATMRRSMAIYNAYSTRWNLPATTLRYRMRPMAERLRDCPS
ncbi:MAG: protein kinase [Sphingomonas sp.]